MTAKTDKEMKAELISNIRLQTAKIAHGETQLKAMIRHKKFLESQLKKIK